MKESVNLHEPVDSRTECSRARPGAPLLLVGCLSVGIAILGCSDVVQDRVVSARLKLVRHVSPLTVVGAFDISAANEVWRDSKLEHYDSQNHTSATTFPEFAGCTIDAVQSADVTVNDPLHDDSVLVILKHTTQDTTPGSPVLATQEGLSMFDQGKVFGTDTIPVFLVPRLGQKTSLGFVFVDPTLLGATFGEGSYAYSIWLSSRRIQETATFGTLAHEMGHIMLPGAPLGPWSDTTPEFLNIMSALGYLRYRRNPNSPSLALEVVTADDQNTRILIEYVDPAGFAHNQCVQAHKFIELGG